MGIPKQRTQFSTRTTQKQEVNPKILNILIQLKSNGKSFRHLRNKLAKKLHDQTLKTIRLYDFRHYYGTTTYKKTNLIYTMQKMGHKRIETTMIYMHLADIPEDEEWICNTPTTKEEMTKLIENGFEHVTDKDGISYFRKPK